MRYARVIVDVPGKKLNKGFDYYIPDDYPAEVEPGLAVGVVFGGREVEGVVSYVMDSTDVPPEKLKPLGSPRISGAAVTDEMRLLAEWMAKRYHCSLAEALRPVIPPGTRRANVTVKLFSYPKLSVPDDEGWKFLDSCPARSSRQAALMSMLLCGTEPHELVQKLKNWRQTAKPLVDRGLVEICTVKERRTPYAKLEIDRSLLPTLMPEQQTAVERVNAAIDQGFSKLYLFGVTGSGKTEVYLRCAKHAEECGKNTIILVPEIALTPQMVQRFRARFGEAVSVLHSALSLGERQDEWTRIRDGEVSVVVGARSAIFAPLPNLGLVIVDEEHESSYRSEKNPRYDAVEVAEHRCRENGATLLMGSATPSLERYRDALEGKTELLTLSGRVMNLPMPEVSIIDMREELKKGNRSMFSEELRLALSDTIARGDQAVLFLNRRGYNTFVSCRDCGEAVKCPSCDVALTYHSFGERLVCHYCGYETTPPKTCPSCGSKKIKYFGAGTERIERELSEAFPDARVLRMDRDTTRGKDSHARILDAFGRGEADILLGTQMVAKGLDFPNITLVGVISADTALHSPDYNAAERAFQLVEQVSGRAGRAGKKGRVVVQTYCPDEPAIALAAEHDYKTFYEIEMKRREEGQFPPYSRFMRMLFVDPDEKKTLDAARQYLKDLRRAMDGFGECKKALLYIGAMQAPIAKIENKYRAQVLIKITECPLADELQKRILEFDDDHALISPKPLPSMEIDPRHMV